MSREYYVKIKITKNIHLEKEEIKIQILKENPKKKKMYMVTPT